MSDFLSSSPMVIPVAANHNDSNVYYIRYSAQQAEEIVARTGVVQTFLNSDGNFIPFTEISTSVKPDFPDAEAVAVMQGLPEIRLEILDWARFNALPQMELVEQLVHSPKIRTLLLAELSPVKFPITPQTLTL